MSALPMERTRSVPIEPRIVVPDTAPTTPTRSRQFTPSPYVQSVQDVRSASSLFDAHLTQPNTVVHQPEHSPVLQSEQLVQEGYGGSYTGPPPHPRPYDTMGLPDVPSLPPAPPMNALPHVPADLQDDGSGELPRLPDETTEGKVLGPVHLELAFALDSAVGNWVCRMCLCVSLLFLLASLYDTHYTTS